MILNLVVVTYKDAVCFSTKSEDLWNLPFPVGVK